MAAPAPHLLNLSLHLVGGAAAIVWLAAAQRGWRCCGNGGTVATCNMMPQAAQSGAFLLYKVLAVLDKVCFVSGLFGAKLVG